MAQIRAKHQPGNADVTSQLVPISLEGIDAGSIDLTKLIEFREREQGRGGSDYTELRHRYLDGLEKYVKELTSVQGRAADAEETIKAWDQTSKLLPISAARARRANAQRIDVADRDALEDIDGNA